MADIDAQLKGQGCLLMAVPVVRLGYICFIPQAWTLFSQLETFKLICNSDIITMSTRPYNTPSRPAAPITEKCVICEKPTDKCCSLCRKVYYCNSDHQEVDWHMKHKFNCQGRDQLQQDTPQADRNLQQPQQKTYNTNDSNFMIYSRNQYRQEPQDELVRKQLEYQSLHGFLALLEQRLVMRNKILGQLYKINERSPQIIFDSLVKQTEQLMVLSTRITKDEYQPSYSRKITAEDLLELGSRAHWESPKDQEMGPLNISDAGVIMEYITDNVLMMKVYHISGMQKQARELILGIGRYLQQPEQSKIFLATAAPKNRSASSLKQSGLAQNPPPTGQQELLNAIIQMSQLYNIDKTTETMYSLFIKRVEQTEGIWEQIYAYFNIAVWYSQKTYYDKANKAFTYALEMLDSHKKNMKESAIFKADCNYNIALGYYAQRDLVKALEHMQQAYRDRANSIGKNSMEASNCLMKLAQWYKEGEKWSECLQYLDECRRIRKLFQDQPEHAESLEETKFLVTQVYEILSSKKQKSIQALNPQSRSYYEALLENETRENRLKQQREQQDSEALPKDSFTSRLFRDDRQFVTFKVNIPIELFETYSTEQINFLGDLIELTDQKMEKSQAIRLLVESKFVLSLDPQQREQFMGLNQIQ